MIAVYLPKARPAEEPFNQVVQQKMGELERNFVYKPPLENEACGSEIYIFNDDIES